MTEILLFIVGIFVGVMNSVAGGGMLIGYPVLLAAGLSPLVANVTGNVVVFPGQLAAANGYKKYIRRLSPSYLLLLIPCLLGAAVGANLLRNIPNQRFEELVPILIFIAVLLFAFQPYLHFKLHTHISKKNRDNLGLAFIAISIFPLAIYGGFFGPGFGFIMLAFLGFTRLNNIHLMNGIKNLGGASISGMAIICLYSAHLINWRFGLTMAAGNIIGGHAGSKYSLRFSTHIIRIIVIFVGLAAAFSLALRTY